MNGQAEVVYIVPAYNEADILVESVGLLMAQLKKQGSNFMVVIASNGSTDNTDSLARKLEAEFRPHLRLLVCRSRGRGAALREAITNFQADSYLYIDADLPCLLEDLPRILEPIKNGADLVMSRRNGARPLRRRLMTAGLRNLIRMAFGLRTSDPQCAIKALSGTSARVLVQDCRQSGWFLDTELIVLCHLHGLTISEVDISWIEQRFEKRRSKVKPLRDSVEFLVALGQITRQRANIRARISG